MRRLGRAPLALAIGLCAAATDSAILLYPKPAPFKAAAPLQSAPKSGALAHPAPASAPASLPPLSCSFLERQDGERMRMPLMMARSLFSSILSENGADISSSLGPYLDGEEATFVRVRGAVAGGRFRLSDILVRRGRALPGPEEGLSRLRAGPTALREIDVGKAYSFRGPGDSLGLPDPYGERPRQLPDAFLPAFGQLSVLDLPGGIDCALSISGVAHRRVPLVIKDR